MPKILIIDDEVKLRDLLARIIGLEGYEVIVADTCKTGLKKLGQHDFDVVLCDVKLPDGNGVELVLELKNKYPEIEVILLTAYGNIPDGVQAIKNGAFDYITKADDNNRIIPLLNRAVEKVELSKRITLLEKQVNQQYSFDSIINKSQQIIAAIELGKKVAPTNTSVLLTGETGSGKEVFAQAIHQASQRKNKSFVALNCSAFSKELLESELFGHLLGAFTGAAKDKKGLFEEANGGTLFLDEIGEMAIELQAKLLRVLETGEFFKVGDSRPTKVDVRIIAATNRELQDEIKQQHFRSDLFYRLAVFSILIPPLRDRPTDIEPLVNHFVSIFSKKMKKRITSIEPEYLAALKHYNWPGNIRELKNIIERSVILCNDVLVFSSLPFELQIKHSPVEPQGTMSAFELASVEKLHIRKVLNYTNGNKTETARLLNIGLTTLYRKIEEYKL